MINNRAGRKLLSVFTRPAYLSIAAAISLLSYITYSLLVNASLLLTLIREGQYSLATTILPGLLVSSYFTRTWGSLLLLLLTSLLIGINFALVAFRLAEQSSFGREGASTLGGMLVAVLAPACPACATALFAVAGLSTAFALLPFNGTEIKVFAVFLLIGSAYWITTQIQEDVCEFC